MYVKSIPISTPNICAHLRMHFHRDVKIDRLSCLEACKSTRHIISLWINWTHTDRYRSSSRDCSLHSLLWYGFIEFIYINLSKVLLPLTHWNYNEGRVCAIMYIWQSVSSSLRCVWVKLYPLYRQKYDFIDIRFQEKKDIRFQGDLPPRSLINHFIIMWTYFHNIIKMMLLEAQFINGGWLYRKTIICAPFTNMV